MKLRQLREVTPNFRVTPTMISRSEGSKGQVRVLMDPRDFLTLTTSDKPGTRFADIEANAHSLNKYNRWSKMGDNEKYSAFVNKGKTSRDDDYEFGSGQHPFLEIELTKSPDGKIVSRIYGHEGRHRAMAYMKKGGKQFPVALMLRPNWLPEGAPKYDNPEYYADASYLPPVLYGQFNKASVSTKPWKITYSQAMRTVDLPKKENPGIKESMEPKKTIFFDLDPVRFQAVLKRKGITPVGFEQSVRSDGRKLINFLIPAEAQEVARKSVFAMPEVGWAEFKPETDGAVRCFVIGENKDFTIKTVVGAMRKLKVDISTSTTTRIRGFHNQSNGFVVSNSYSNPGAIEVNYRGPHTDEGLHRKYMELEAGLEGLGLFVEFDDKKFIVMGFREGWPKS